MILWSIFCRKWLPFHCVTAARPPMFLDPIIQRTLQLQVILYTPPSIFWPLLSLTNFNTLSTRMNGHHSSNSPDNLPLLVTTHTRSHKLPFDSYWNVRAVHRYPQYQLTLPTAILNFSINSFYPPDKAQVLTSDNYLSLLPPYSLFLSLVALNQNCHMVPSLLCVHIYSYSCDWQRPLWVLKCSN